MTGTPLDRLILLRLALVGGESKNADFTPALKKPDRDRLTRAGLLASENRTPPGGGRKSLYLVMTDGGWAWLADQLAGDLPPRAGAVKPLQALLALLKTHLDAHALSLAEFMSPPTSGPPPGAEEQIERAYYRITGGKANTRVRLADLRAELPDIPRERLDGTLLEMATKGAAALYPLENPLEIHPQDRDAVLLTPTGHERHILYLGGRPS